MNNWRPIIDAFKSIIILVLIVFFSVATAPVSEAARKIAVDQETDGQTYLSLENNPRAVVKEGLFVGFEKERVAILTGSKSKKQTYRIDEDYRVLYNEQEIDWEEVDLKQIPPHSIVKLVMIDGQVVEIILVEVSS